MPFHITITTRRDAQAGGPLRALDLPPERLNQDFIELLRLGGSITWRGRTIDPNEIVRVRVIETEGRWADWLADHPHGDLDWDEFLEQDTRMSPPISSAGRRTPKRRRGTI